MIANMGKDDQDTDDNDKQLWQYVTRDVKKLGAADRALPDTRPRRIRLREDRPLLVAMPHLTLPEGGGIDRKTEDKVRKGEMRIEGRLDLHGLNVDSARVALLQFVKLSYASNKRCVLAITGKGRKPGESAFATGAGVIRREFSLWLEDASVKPFILSVSQAQPRHGGSGAFYIYLRKSR